MHPTEHAPSRAPAPLPRPPRSAVPVVVTTAVAALGPVALAASSLTFGQTGSSTAARIGMVLLGGGVLVTVLGWVVAGITVAVWTARARAVADVLAPGAHRHTSGWAAGGWFVPFAALFVPPRVVGDIARASDPAGDGVRVGTWWTSWLVGHAALALAFGTFGAAAASGGPGASEAFLPFLVLAFVAAAAHVTAAVALAGVVRTVTAWQQART